MPFHQLYYHLVWGTKNRQPLITPEIEPLLYRHLRFKAVDLEGVIYALDGTEDHVHMVVSIPPKLAVATFVGQVKGASSAQLNKSRFSQVPFFWQGDYGAFSFDRKRLPYVVGYVEKQKEHHASGKLIPVLERTEQPLEVREPKGSYLVDEDAWIEEMQRWDD